MAGWWKECDLVLSLKIGGVFILRKGKTAGPIDRSSGEAATVAFKVVMRERERERDTHTHTQRSERKKPRQTHWHKRGPDLIAREQKVPILSRARTRTSFANPQPTTKKSKKRKEKKRKEKNRSLALALFPHRAKVFPHVYSMHAVFNRVCLDEKISIRIVWAFRRALVDTW